MSNRYLEKALLILEELPENKAKTDFEKYCQVYWKTKILNVAKILKK